jgi:competence ComEA-like helix-hairpin-helix protein
MKRNLGENTKAAQALIVAATLAVFSSCAKPTRVRSTSYETSTTAPGSITTRININTASVEELEKLPGIGKALAARIVEHRQNYGPFRKPEHLMVVPGISDQKFRIMRELIVAQ